VTDRTDLRAERPRITVPQLAMAIPAQELQRWLAKAKPGQTIMYAEGAALPRGAAACTLAREHAEIGTVELKAERGPRGWRFLATKRAMATGGAARAKAAPRVDDDAEAVLRVLRRCAQLDLECPSNGALAEAAKLNDGDAARYQLRKLAAAGTIRVEHFGPMRPRRVTIVATGKRTREVAA
jgi:hypothetical protein